MDKGIYHIGKGEIPRKCRAVTRTCRYGKHFSSRESAQRVVDNRNTKEAIPVAIKKPVERKPASETEPISKAQAALIKKLFDTKEVPDIYLDTIREMWKIDRQNEKLNEPYKILLSKFRADKAIKTLYELPDKK